MAYLLNPSGIITISGSLTNSQIKNIHGTPVQVLPAPGAGRFYKIINTTGKLIYGGNNAFVAGAAQTVAFFYSTALLANACINNTTLTQTASVYNSPVGLSFSNVTLATFENAPINLYNNIATEISGNAANDNIITYSLTYQIISI